MKVRLHSTYASPKGAGNPGDVINLDKSTAKQLIADGYASKLGDDRPRQTPAQPTSETSSGSEPDGLEVPDGKADEIVAWIGDDPDRATAAKAAEEAATRPRKTVLAHAESVLAPEPEGGSE